jgi:uracil-DNA glycosylase
MGTQATCHRCKRYGLTFERSYGVSEFLEGYPDSQIWIIGLNPAADIGWKDEERTAEHLAEDFRAIALKHPYFKDFNRVSPWLYSLLGERRGVAHTDLVKCSSKQWPPPNCTGKAVSAIVANCTPFLREQLIRYKPKMVICNGAEVCAYIKTAIPPVDLPDRATSYRGTVDGTEIWVVLSGFIGRIDNYSRMRLGAESERLASQLGIRA